MRIPSQTYSYFGICAFSIVVAIIALLTLSCNSGDDAAAITTTPAANAPSTARPENTPATKQSEKPATPTAANSTTVPRLSYEEIAPMLMSELRNAAVAQEAYFTDWGHYAIDIKDLSSFGYEPSANINIVGVMGDGALYCMEAFHVENHNLVMYFLSHEGEPRQGSCP